MTDNENKKWYLLYVESFPEGKEEVTLTIKKTSLMTADMCRAILSTLS